MATLSGHVHGRRWWPWREGRGRVARPTQGAPPVAEAKVAVAPGKEVFVNARAPVHPRQWMLAPAEAAKPVEEVEVEVVVGKEANTPDNKETSAG